MKQEVFKAGILYTIIIPTVISAIILGLFFTIEGIPSWLLVFLIIPAVFAITGQTTRLVVEGNILHYQHGLIIKQNDEVSLHQVEQIVMRVIETWERDSEGNHTSRRVRIIYVLDDSGKTYFSFPANLVNKGNKLRFKEVINNINPNIHFSI